MSVGISATPSVTAYFFMHGSVNATKKDDSCSDYSVTGKKLPPRTELYAPKILGKSYHATNIIYFVSELKNNWNENSEGRVSFSEFCFYKIVDYERTQVERMEQEIKDSDFFRFMESAITSEPRERKKRRLFLEGAIVQKSQIRWDKHEYFISEKSYYVNHRDKIKNCIMFFCDIPPIKPLDTQEIKLSNGNNFTVFVSYNNTNKLFKITFDKWRRFIFSFEELNQIVQIVVKNLNRNLDFNLALFDFSCCITSFEYDDCLRHATPELLSSVTLDPLPKLIYGTVSEHRQRELESALERGIFANYDSQVFSQKESLSEPSSPAHKSHDSHSPARAGPLLTVHLLKGAESFADEPVSRFFNRRTSPDDPRSDSDGGRRRRDRHFGNKVSRKRITYRSYRRTKAHSKRSKRQRKTK